MAENTSDKSPVTVSMNYRDAPRAIEWLCQAFGFQKHAIYPGPNNTIIQAELTLGNGMIMLSTAEKENPYNKRFMKQPDEIDGAETRCVNLIVPDPDAVYNRVKETGGKILLDIEDKHYGGRGFTCCDFEGTSGTSVRTTPGKRRRVDPQRYQTFIINLVKCLVYLHSRVRDGKSPLFESPAAKHQTCVANCSLLPLIGLSVAECLRIVFRLKSPP
jgi:uncharacterized glyoxalase superfamily protein PhnB